MKSSDFSITFDIEPIVKLSCQTVNCRNNLMSDHIGMLCNLKHIDIGETGRCLQFDPMPSKPDEIKE